MGKPTLSSRKGRIPRGTCQITNATFEDLLQIVASEKIGARALMHGERHKSHE